MEFHLAGRVSTDDPAVLRPVLEEIIRCHSGTYRALPEEGFEVSLTWEAPSARDANRELLNTLRRTVKKTRLRAEWTHGRLTERFFDYVPKSTYPAKRGTSETKR
jgi:regulator of sirC expression with transglutaminase-like and TPR domain